VAYDKLNGNSILNYTDKRTAKHEITFGTQCYEKDWKFLLKGNYLKQMIERCKYNFAQKILIINNVNNRREVEKYAKKLCQQNVLDKYYFASDHTKSALNSVEIEMDEGETGYYYLNAPLVCVNKCETKYLLYFTTDAYMASKCPNGWIDLAISIFEMRDHIIVANPVWNYCYEEAIAESFDKIDDFCIGYGFSDQCFLIETDNFKKNIYNEKNPLSERYPLYADGSFEKRIDSFMRNKGYLRITYMKGSYIHNDFPKQRITLGMLLLFMKVFKLEYTPLFRRQDITNYLFFKMKKWLI
jgi:hypothetical protein